MTRLITLTFALIASLTFTNSAEANRSSESYALCKQAAAASHGDAKVTLKKLKARSQTTELKLKVVTSEDSFTAKCIVSRDGTVDYSPNNQQIDQAVVTQN